MKDPELQSLSVDDIPNNSFLVVRVDVSGPMEKMVAANDLLKLIQPYKDILAQKNVSLMVFTPKEGFEVLTEDEMNMAGWVRKEKVENNGRLDSNT